MSEFKDTGKAKAVKEGAKQGKRGVWMGKGSSLGRGREAWREGCSQHPSRRFPIHAGNRRLGEAQLLWIHLTLVLFGHMWVKNLHYIRWGEPVALQVLLDHRSHHP